MKYALLERDKCTGRYTVKGRSRKIKRLFSLLQRFDSWEFEQKKLENVWLKTLSVLTTIIVIVLLPLTFTMSLSASLWLHRFVDVNATQSIKCFWLACTTLSNPNISTFLKCVIIYLYYILHIILDNKKEADPCYLRLIITRHPLLSFPSGVFCGTSTLSSGQCPPPLAWYLSAVCVCLFCLGPRDVQTSHESWRIVHNTPQLWKLILDGDSKELPSSLSRIPYAENVRGYLKGTMSRKIDC